MIILGATGRFWSIRLVDYPHDFSAQCDVLTDALDDPGTDLSAVLAVLVDDLEAAIPSMLGLTVAISETGNQVTVTSAESDLRTVGASLRLPLDEMTAATAGSTMTFYAAQPGAFVDMAADIRHAYHLNGHVVVDGHLDDVLPTGHSGITGLTEHSLINQAIGVLIGQGHHPDTTRTVLQHRADHTGGTLAGAAQHVLDELAR
jgi:hypothetical protein